MYADIHCYPAKVAYNTYALTPEKPELLTTRRSTSATSGRNNPKKNIFTEPSQCDLNKSVQARVKLMFAALYPIEKGFLYGHRSGRINKEVIGEYLIKTVHEGEKNATMWLSQLLKTIPGLESIKQNDLVFLRNRYNKFPFEKLISLQNDSYDYFDELKREYKFYLSNSSQNEFVQINSTKEGTYQLARNGSDVLHRLRPDNNDILIVFTMEGIHALGLGNPEDEFLHPGEMQKDVTIGKLKSRIRQLKGEENLDDPVLEKWEHCPFFITFAHHFNNTLCGHAHSLPNLSRHVYDQRKNMDKGVLKNVTYDVLLELLGLDNELNSTGSRRILIDIKHMSAASRQDFYKKIIRPHNRKPENILSKIPIIASHVAYSGIDTLDLSIQYSQQGKEEDDFYINGFKAWNINLCDEDIIEIHDSNGLIGITLDQFLLGSYHHSWLTSFQIQSLEKRKAKNILARTLEQFIRIPFDYNLTDPMKIWDILCIGTGFDGVANQLNAYSTVLDLTLLEDDIIQILSRMRRERPKWFGNQSPENLARKICFENAYDFVVEHYR